MVIKFSHERNGDTLYDDAKRFEEKTYFPGGIELDDCPYAASPQMRERMVDRFGEDALREKIREWGGDENCWNWQVMTGLSLLGITLRHP